MDAAAYLRRQGWRGTGHSLDHTDRGIKKPLQISKKVDALGVGIQKYGAVSDQWWMRAYDQGLKTLGTGVQGDLEQVRKHGHGRGGLYARFVKGQPIPGTIDEYLMNTSLESQSSSDDTANSSRTKALKCTPVTKRLESMRGARKRRRKENGLETGYIGPDETARDVRMAVRMYVNEAIRRGIITPKTKNDRPKRESSISRPIDADMVKVLALAGLSEGQVDNAMTRQHKTRALKRAAIQHFETTMDVR